MKENKKNIIKYIKKIFPWVVPEKWMTFIMPIALSFKNCNLFFSKNKILLKNKLLKNKYKNKRCFIIGNGSSINQMNLEKLENEFVFTMNFFTEHTQLEQINPTFYSSIEPPDSLSDFSNNCIYHPDNYYVHIEKKFKNLNTIFFFHDGCKKIFEDKNLFRGRDVYYLKSYSSFYQDSKYSIKSRSDISKPFSFMDASLYNAICCCVYMGFKELYLIGFDNDSILKDNELHFYKEPEPIYNGNVKPYNCTLFKEEKNKNLAYQLYTSLEATEIVKNYFEPMGVEIYNAGIGGFVDTFQRVNFEKLF